MSRLQPEFQVIIMSGYGANLYPLTCDSMPKGLLPIGNKPLLYYSLKWIEKTCIKGT
jgi:translation initiation factor eIF-2B subunit gamma